MAGLRNGDPLSSVLVRYDTRITLQTFPLNYECTPNEVAERRAASCFKHQTIARNKRRVRFKMLAKFIVLLYYLLSRYSLARWQRMNTLPPALYADSRLELLLCNQHALFIRFRDTLYLRKFHEYGLIIIWGYFRWTWNKMFFPRAFRRCVPIIR